MNLSYVSPTSDSPWGTYLSQIDAVEPYLGHLGRWVETLRTTEHADVVVIAMHMGMEADLRTGEPNPGQVPDENAALAIARDVPGVDAIFMGHTHREVPNALVNGVLLVQANLWGRHLARADIYLEQDAQRRWRVVAKQSRTVPVTADVEPDPAIAAMAASYDRETQAWLARTIGTSDAELTSSDTRVRDTAILDLVQRVQLDAGQADVSMVASFNAQARIPRGDVAVRDVFGLYIYDNTLLAVRVTGADIRAYLEYSARYFKQVSGTGPFTIDQLTNAVTTTAPNGTPDYNFDSVAGLDAPLVYDIDVSKPAGSRITTLTYDGAAVTDAQQFVLAVNNYRQSGGGGFPAVSTAPVVYNAQVEIRQLLIDWVTAQKTIDPALFASLDWRLVSGGQPITVS